MILNEKKRRVGLLSIENRLDYEKWVYIQSTMQSDGLREGFEGFLMSDREESCQRWSKLLNFDEKEEKYNILYTIRPGMFM